MVVYILCQVQGPPLSLIKSSVSRDTDNRCASVHAKCFWEITICEGLQACMTQTSVCSGGKELPTNRKKSTFLTAYNPEGLIRSDPATCWPCLYHCLPLVPYSFILLALCHFSALPSLPLLVLLATSHPVNLLHLNTFV
jgi:hypothetical protein